MVNEKHTLALDRLFFEANLPGFGFRVDSFSEPYDPSIIRNAISYGVKLDTRGVELLVIGLKVTA